MYGGSDAAPAESDSSVPEGSVAAVDVSGKAPGQPVDPEVGLVAGVANALSVASSVFEATRTEIDTNRHDASACGTGS